MDENKLNTSNYDDSSIESNDGASGVRRRPASLLGSDGIAGARHGFIEISGNASDEALSGYGDLIEINYDEVTNVVSVRDFGRGVPMGWNSKEEKFNWHLVYNDLYSSGKFKDHQTELEKVKNWDLFDPKSIPYLFTIGLNGVGASATQFTSKFMSVMSIRDGLKTTMRFYKGYPILSYSKAIESLNNGTQLLSEKVVDEVIQLLNDAKGNMTENIKNLYISDMHKELGYSELTDTSDLIVFNNSLTDKLSRLGFYTYKIEPLVEETDVTSSSTTVLWTPDNEIFSETYLDKEWILSFKDSLQYITGITLKCVFHNDGEREEYLFQQGNIVDLHKERNGIGDTKEVFYTEGLTHGTTFSGGRDKIYVLETTAVFSLSDGSSVHDGLAFVNGIPTTMGVQHSYAHTAFADFARGVLSEYSRSLRVSDFSGYFEYTISSKTNIASYLGQTKGGVDDAFIGDHIYYVILNKLQSEFRTGNKAVNDVVNQIKMNIETRLATEKHQKELRELKKATKNSVSQLPDKFTSCEDYDDRKYANVELFICEGESAGGSVRNGRDSKFQCIYELTGKFTNFLKKSDVELVQTKVFTDLMNIIGVNIEVTNTDIILDTSKLKVKRILIMTDADVDGQQIRVLLFNLFYRFLPDLLRQGFIEVALPPLYRIETANNETIYCVDEQEYNYIANNNTIKSQKHFKGLGEMNADEFGHTSLDPKYRRTVPLNLSDDEGTQFMVNTLFGSDEQRQRKPLILSLLGQDYEQVESNIKDVNRQLRKEIEDEDYMFIDLEM